ncbi:MAG: hypothetical protein KGD57_09910 [Candidatus Lokiarchaeota archaeon]|nr:hypothetical protein [Candidatus Lokiarchaeota archaeon]
MVISNIGRNTLELNKFIDFDRNQNIIYDNIYLKDYDIVIKTPIFLNEKYRKKIKLEKFRLTKYVYLIDHE